MTSWPMKWGRANIPALSIVSPQARILLKKRLAWAYISLSGIVTFKNARDLQSSATKIPADRLLIETDSPFLAPVPHRGRPCEPAFVVDTAAFLASLRDTSVTDLAETTRANFFALFAKAKT